MQMRLNRARVLSMATWQLDTIDTLWIRGTLERLLRKEWRVNKQGGLQPALQVETLTHQEIERH